MLKLKKNTYKTWMAALLLGMATLPSCEKETLNVTFDEVPANTLTLNLVCSENQSSRAADNTNNEDAIHRLDIFLYPLDAEFDTPSVGDPITLTGINKNESHSFSVPLDNAVIESLFGKDEDADRVDNCRIYVIANLPAGTTLPTGNPTVNQLKSLAITGSFAQFAQVNGATTSTYQPQTDFVMDSDFTIDIETINNISVTNDQVTLDRTTHKLTGRVPLYRAASKISLEITAVNPVTLTNENNEPVYEILTDGSYRTEPNSINEEPIKWVANTTGMQVRLHDGVKNGFIDYSKQLSEAQKLEDEDYYSFYNSENQTSLDVPMVKADDETIWRHNPAFYSYSSNWGEGGSDKDPYLTLIVPWQLSTKTNSYESTYYQIPINTITKKLERNTHYKISLVVSRLGSFVEEKPEVISPSSYIIVPWQSETVNADLMDYRYLMVEEKDITIYNEEELYIPYVTSHEAEIVYETCEQMDLSLQIPDWKYATYDELNLTQKEGFIYFKNELDNDYASDTFDFSPYRITFIIRHKDEEGREKYLEKVTINQYPAIYGEAFINSDFSNYDNMGASVNNDHKGYVFVNGYQGRRSNNNLVGMDNQDYFCSARGFTNDDGSPNMYVFTVTSVEGTDYIIGDPRENTIDTNFINQTHDGGYSIWADAPALYNNDEDGKRTLQYYYATDVDYTSENTMKQSRTKNMIAPKFRIASAYAVLTYNDDGTEPRYLDYLKKRCASYQEDGFPAGRWRLPTEAEFKLIISQVNKEPATLPALYITDSKYWCAHGLGTPNENGTVDMEYITYDRNNGHSTRCVYDEWYWGSSQLENKSQFTWGDQPR